MNKVKVFLLINKVLSFISFLGFLLIFLEAILRGVKSVCWLLSNNARKGYFKKCGKGVFIKGEFQVKSPSMLIVGDNVHINDRTYFRAGGGITIGDNCHFSRGLTIYSENHNYSGESIPYDAKKIKKPVVIGENVWIGMNVNVCPGATIGSGAIVGMGSVVVGDIPPLSIVGGNPAKVLKYRDRQHYESLVREGRFGGVSGYPIGDN